MPRRNAIARICKYFGLEEDDILSDKVGLAAKEHGKNSDSLNTRTIKGMPMGYVPLRGKVHAGTPDEPEVYEQEMVLAPQFLIDDDPDLYACKSEGDCMNRVYPEGCIIFVSPNKEPRNGSVAVVTIDGTGYGDAQDAAHFQYARAVAGQLQSGESRHHHHLR